MGFRFRCNQQIGNHLPFSLTRSNPRIMQHRNINFHLKSNNSRSIRPRMTMQIKIEILPQDQSLFKFMIRLDNSPLCCDRWEIIRRPRSSRSLSNTKVVDILMSQPHSCSPHQVIRSAPCKCSSSNLKSLIDPPYFSQ